MLLIDDGLVALPANHRQDITTYGLPATQIAEQGWAPTALPTPSCSASGRRSSASSVDEAMRHAVAESVPAKTVDLNLKAFDAGYEDGKRQLAESPDGDLRQNGGQQA